jgi:hypothetical protein
MSTNDCVQNNFIFEAKVGTRPDLPVSFRILNGKGWRGNVSQHDSLPDLLQPRGKIKLNKIGQERVQQETAFWSVEF